MTMKELVKAVVDGDIKSVEVYEDYFQSWSEDKRSMFLAELTAKMVGELAANTRWKEFTYDRCRFCSDYLRKKWDEEKPNDPKDEMEKTTKAKEQQQESESDSLVVNGNCMTADDLLLRIFFGDHLTDFFREAPKCKDGTKVARLVNWYINEYNLDTDRTYRKKPLHDALFAKGIIKIGVNGWNKAIK